MTSTPEPPAIDYQANIQKIYHFSFFWMFLIIIPVIVPYFLSLGLNMEEVFKLQAIFGVTVAILEVPSGYLCDLWGRKKTMLIGTFLSGIGFAILFFAKNWWQLVLFEITVASALSMVSGADIAILYESLNYVNDSRHERTKAMATIQWRQALAESSGAILGGLLVNISFKAVALVHALFGWAPFFIALTIKEPPYQKMDSKSHWSNVKEILAHIFTRDKLLALVFINLVIWGLSTFIAVWVFQKYWQENAIPLYYFGPLWAAYNFTVGVAGKQVHKLEKRFGPIPLLIAVGVLPIIGHFSLAFFSGWLGVIAGLFFQVARGFNQVILKDALNWRTPNHSRATVNSLVGLFFRFGFFLVGPVIGHSLDVRGISLTLQNVAMAFIFVFILFMLPLIREVKKIAPEAIPSH